jgi:ABC-type uncharacterized transport system permease subunit
MKRKIIVCLALVVSGVLSGCSGMAEETETLDKLVNEAVVSAGSNYVECERGLLAADDSVLVTLQANLHSIEPGPGNTARVMTGVNDHPLAGGGHWFDLKRVGKKWKTTQQGPWAS